MKDFSDMSDEERATFEQNIERSRMAREAVRREYGAFFDAVAEILFRHDPVGINFEDNSDEYEPEAGTIIPRLKSCDSLAAAEVVVLDEFKRWFGDLPSIDQNKCRDAARDIWRLWLTRG